MASLTIPKRAKCSRGISILEVLISIIIFMLALIPVADLFSTSNRMAASAQRFLEATLHAQTLLEAVCEIDPDDLPRLPDAPATGDADDKLLLDSDGNQLSGGKGRWPELVTWFNKPPAFPMERRQIAGQ